MLSASTASPKPTPQSTPTPHNWHGVTQGLLTAKQSFHHNDFKGAEKVLRDILEFSPSEPKAWAWLGRIMQLQSHTDEANEYFEKSMQLLYNQHKIPPKPAESISLAQLLYQQGELDAAQLMLNNLLLQDPDHNELLQLSKSWKEQA
ncbi:MAG: hypothetical protein R8K49_04290 [Mariprofundaceae bacterium]